MKRVFALVLLFCMLVSCKINQDGKILDSKVENKDEIIFIQVIDDEGNYIIDETFINFYEGQTVFDALKKVCEDRGIDLSYRGFGTNIYVEGIGNLFERDKGPLSGWLFLVNEKLQKMGIGKVELLPLDRVKIVYTTDGKV